MSSRRKGSSDAHGVQQPRICHIPPGAVSSAAEEALELCEMAGLHLDPWEQLVLARSLDEREDGKWAAFEVGLMVSRQNGKGAVLEARELTGLFLLGERLLTHTAHLADTSLEAFLRLMQRIEETPELDRRVAKVSRTHGLEGITLRSGQRIRFRTRTKGGGRGFSGDWLGLDEAMFIPEAMIGALMPTLAAMPNPQVWYCGSAVDQRIHDDGLVFARVRARALEGDDPRLLWCEWSADCETPADVQPETARDPAVWAASNPALGIRITHEYVSDERRAMDPRTFAVERLGVGDWPSLDGSGSVISLERWRQLVDPDSKALDPVCFAFDVAPDRSSSSIGVAGRRDDDLLHVEIIENRRGTGWVVARLVELKEKHDPVAIVCDAAGPAASLLHELEELGIEVTLVTAKEHAQACGLIFDAVDQAKIRHLGTSELSTAIGGAAKRPLGDAWAWSRKTSDVDISPLVACTLAVWGAMTVPVEEEGVGFAVISIGGGT